MKHSCLHLACGRPTWICGKKTANQRWYKFIYVASSWQINSTV